MATSVIMETVDQLNNKSTRSLTHINPSASTTELKNFAEGLNGLTTNTVSNIRRVETTDILNDAALPRNVQITDLSDQPITEVKIDSIPNNMSDALLILVTYDSNDYTNDQITRTILADEFANDETLFIGITRYNDGTEYKGLTIMLAKPSTLIPLTLHFEIGATSSYQAATFDIPIVS